MEPHKLDTVSLITGLIFLVTGIGHLLGFNLMRLWSGLGGLLPLVLIIGGGVLLLRVLRRANDS
jgi:hypothetical protein